MWSSAAQVTDAGRCHPVPAPVRLKKAGGGSEPRRVGVGAGRRAPRQTPRRAALPLGVARRLGLSCWWGQRGQSRSDRRGGGLLSLKEPPSPLKLVPGLWPYRFGPEKGLQGLPHCREMATPASRLLVPLLVSLFPSSAHPHPSSPHPTPGLVLVPAPHRSLSPLPSPVLPLGKAKASLPVVVLVGTAVLVSMSLQL